MTEKDKLLLELIKETMDPDEVVDVLEIGIDKLVDILEDEILESPNFDFYRESLDNDTEV